uniref:Uncharacterized protein n=1 Tax=Glossina brevipalpis TaxID=37001 RepID=A0A1A9WZW1_9MUSC
MLINRLNWFTGWLTIALLQGNFLALNLVHALPVDKLENPIKQLQLNLVIMNQQLKSIGKEIEACMHAFNTTDATRNTTSLNNSQHVIKLEKNIPLDQNLPHVAQEKTKSNENFATSADNQAINENLIRKTRALAVTKEAQQSFAIENMGNVTATTNVNIPNAINVTTQADHQIHSFASFTQNDPVNAGEDHQSLFSSAETAYTLSENVNKYPETQRPLIIKSGKLPLSQRTLNAYTKTTNVTHASNETVSFSRPQKVYGNSVETENKTITNKIESFDIEEEKLGYGSFGDTDPLTLAINQTVNVATKMSIEKIASENETANEKAAKVTDATKETNSLKAYNNTSVDARKLTKAEVSERNVTRIVRGTNATQVLNKNESVKISEKSKNESEQILSTVNKQNLIPSTENATALNATYVTQNATESNATYNSNQTLDGNNYDDFTSHQLQNYIISSQSKCATGHATVEQPFVDMDFRATDLLGFLLNQTLNSTYGKRSSMPYHKTLSHAKAEVNESEDAEDNDDVSTESSTEEKMAEDTSDLKQMSDSFEKSEDDANKKMQQETSGETEKIDGDDSNKMPLETPGNPEKIDGDDSKKMAEDTSDLKQTIEKDKGGANISANVAIDQLNTTANAAANAMKVVSEEISNTNPQVTSSGADNASFAGSKSIISLTYQQSLGSNATLAKNTIESNMTHVNNESASLQEVITHNSTNNTTNKQNLTTNAVTSNESLENRKTSGHAQFEEMSPFQFLVNQVGKNSTATNAKSATHASSKTTSGNLKTKSSNISNVTHKSNTTTKHASHAHSSVNLSAKKQGFIDDPKPDLEIRENEPLTPYLVAGFAENKAAIVVADVQNSSAEALQANTSEKNFQEMNGAASFAENEPTVPLSNQQNLIQDAKAEATTLVAKAEEANDKASKSVENQKATAYASFRESEALKALVNDIVRSFGAKKNASKKTNTTHLAHNKNETAKALNVSLIHDSADKSAIQQNITDKVGAASATKANKGQSESGKGISGVSKVTEIKSSAAINQQTTNSTSKEGAANTTNGLSKSAETAEIKSAAAINQQKTNLASKAGTSNITKGLKGLTKSDEDTSGLSTATEIKPGAAIIQQTANLTVTTNATYSSNETVALNTSELTSVTNTTSESIATSTTSSVITEKIVAANATDLIVEVMAGANTTIEIDGTLVTKNSSETISDSVATGNPIGVTIEIVSIQNTTNPANESVVAAVETGTINQSVPQANTTSTSNETLSAPNATNSTNETVNSTKEAEAADETHENATEANVTNPANESMSTENATNITHVSASADNATNTNQENESAENAIKATQDAVHETDATADNVAVVESQAVQTFASFAERNPLATFVNQVIKRTTSSNETNAINETLPCNNTQEPLKSKCASTDQENLTQSTEMINVDSTGNGTHNMPQEVAAVRSFGEIESFRSLKYAGTYADGVLTFEGSKKSQQQARTKDNLVNQINAPNNSIIDQLVNLQDLTVNEKFADKSAKMLNMSEGTSKNIENKSASASVHLYNLTINEGGTNSMHMSKKNQSDESFANKTTFTEDLKPKPTDSRKQKNLTTNEFNSPEKVHNLALGETTKTYENLKDAFNDAEAAQKFYVTNGTAPSNSSNVNNFSNFVKNEKISTKKTKTSNSTAHSMHSKEKIVNKAQVEIEKPPIKEFTSSDFRFQSDSEFYRRPHFLYIDQEIKPSENPLASTGTMQAMESKINTTDNIKNVTNICCQTNCTTTMGCKGLKNIAPLNITLETNVTNSAFATPEMKPHLSETSNVTLQVTPSAERAFAEENESIQSKPPDADQNNQEIKENFVPESPSTLHNIEFLKIAQNLAYEFARGENQITEEEFGRVAKFEEDEEGEFNADDDAKSITEEEGRDSRNSEDDSEDVSAKRPAEPSMDFEEITTTDFNDERSDEPEERMSEERAPRKLMHHRNLDGVEMFYGYSNVKYN